MIRVGISAPASRDLVVTSAFGDVDPVSGLPVVAPDLTTVTSATIEVKRPGGDVVSWSAAIASATATKIVLRHVFAAPDCPVAGKYQARALLTTPAGVVRSDVDLFTVSPF